VPFYSLILMLLPAVGLSAVYAYNSTFVKYTYDATLVIAITFLFSAIAVVLLPFIRRTCGGHRHEQGQDPRRADRPVAGWITIGLLGFNLYEWFSNDLYFVNNHSSLYFMAALYVLAIALYVVARLVRKRQGDRPRPDQQGDPVE